MVELYEKDGQVGVLISPGYGAGFSTWNRRPVDGDKDVLPNQIAFDKRVIDFWLAHKDDRKWMSDLRKDGSAAEREAHDFFESCGYGDYVCVLGFPDIQLEFVDRGRKFYIDEYDGFESIKYLDELENVIEF